MRALVIDQLNAPWTITDVPAPRPAPGQVVIRVRYSGMCGTDLHVHHGLFPLPTPIVAGHEPTGEIVEVGAGVTELRVGDRVGVFWNQKGCGRCAACQAGRHCAETQTWMNVGGGNSELMLAWASGCALVPDELPLEYAAPLFCAGYTAMSGIRNGAPRPGERVAILGTGGLGHLGIQISKALGLETFAITGQADKRAELIGLGADEVLVARDDVGTVLRDAGGADVILSTTNSAAQIGSAFTALRPRGRLVNTGVADGPIGIDSFAALSNQTELRGSTQDHRSHLFEVLQLAARGKVRPRIETYPLERANEARDRLAAGKVRYRAVLQHAP
jgi:2-desacetyl-2-hydroxyethyl bacteriochlorophyllide A dehydrogenase